ncbi:L-seryl-tRNA selenium transferase [Campylobacter mucosalis]|uniref:PQQ-binding-like beta-propeller repeat protein n=1 Tax=Campylobacter mucosalis TaxID=202 RepID=UPI0004D6C7A7|nr:PQQ-binding-like beta-propeller repeat protein [Campylobacter mucosalis]KEA46199.1 L-seryl-tRNA selenium transferase [Campylobacter mucosalis]QKF62653.1 putative beta-barrel assembly machinery complex lipoprotein BamB [Campylobacter mucosalis]
MKKIALLLTTILALLLTGCNTKRQYFEPETTDGSMKLSSNLPSSIKYTSTGGATLSNGNIITKDGLNSNVKLQDGFYLLSENNDMFISTNINGELMVTDSTGAVVFSRTFPTSVVSASLENNLLAAVSAANHIYLIDIFESKTLMEYKSSEISAIDSRVAAPLFLSTIIIYPSLDGKIYIVNKANSQILRDIVVSSENFFNNITYLDVVDDYMIASTAKRVIVINPQKTIYFDGEIKSVLLDEKNLYIFLKDGSIRKTDLALNTLAKSYFKFAIFSDATISNDSLYIAEKTGYIIKTDLDLNNPKIFEFSNEIEDKSFMGRGKFYYDDEFIEF